MPLRQSTPPPSRRRPPGPASFAASASPSSGPFCFSGPRRPGCFRSSLQRPLLFLPFAARPSDHCKTAQTSVAPSFLLPRPSFARSDAFSGGGSPGQSSTPLHSTPLPTPPTTPPPSESRLPESFSLPRYSPFALCSITLLTCSSNSGKTRVLTEIVRHRDRFFQDHDQIIRVVYFNLNARDTGVDHPWTGDCGGTRAKIDRDYHTVDDPDDFDVSDRRESEQTNPLGLEVTSLNLEDLKDLGSILRPRDIVVLDDLLQLTEEVQFLLKYGVHHLKLYLFVVTQTCLSSPLYSLIQSIHNLLLIFGNTATTRLAQHVVQTFFLCSDTKAYLKAIFAISEKQQDTVVLKLNSVASYRPHSNVLALSRVQSLFESDPPYCFVYRISVRRINSTLFPKPLL